MYIYNIYMFYCSFMQILSTLLQGFNRFILRVYIQMYMYIKYINNLHNNYSNNFSMTSYTQI